jgi:cell division protein FtsZ
VEAAPEPMAEPAAPEAYAPAQQAPVEVPVVVGPAVTMAEPAPRTPEAVRTQPGMMTSLFRRATSMSHMMRRTLPEAQPAMPAHAVRVEPSVVPQQAQPAPRAAATRQPAQDEMGLEIPTFLRRQSNY